MADVQNKILNTRIQLKYDTYAEWSKNNPTLLPGEIAIAILTDVTSQTGANAAGTTGQHPVLFKVGPGEFNTLPWASALAADVYAWAKEASLNIDVKLLEGQTAAGNVISGIEWDATANDGKGGIKYTTASVATSEGLQKVQEDIAAIEKDIADNRDAWAKDDNTTYTFTQSEDGKTVTITPSEGDAQTLIFQYLTQNEIEEIFKDYYTKDEIDELIKEVNDNIPTEVGVMSVAGSQAITATGDANVTVGLKLDSTGNISLSQSDAGLKAEIDLSDYSKTVSVKKEETSAEGVQATYKVYTGDAAVDVAIEIPESTKVEDSDKNGYIKVDSEEVMVYDEIFGVDMATVNALGGIAAGTNLKDKTIHEVLNALLFPYVKPTVGTPSRTPNTTSALEKGNDQTITAISVTVTKKSEPITSVALYQGDAKIAEKTGDEVKNGGTFTFSGLNIAVPSSSVTLKVKVTDAAGSTVESNSTAGWTFVYPYYYGVSAADAVIDEALVEGLTKKIEAKGTKNWKFTTNNQKMTFAYPKSYGALKKILDPNGFDYINDFNRSEVSITGLDETAQIYYVYVQKDVSTLTDFTMSFQY